MEEYSKYSEWGFRIVDINKNALPDFKPHAHQREVWKKLDSWSKRREGLVALPTGAGKTYTAIHWLFKNALSDPDRRPVLWIAHRAELIQQAAESFAKYTGLARREDALTIRCISGVHNKPVTSLLKTADVTLATIQSLSTRLDVVSDFFLKNKDCVVVVDEAHHAAAKTYREVLSIARRYKKVELLGLTATPTRTIEEEVSYLRKLFPDGIISQIDQASLIEKKILSRPIVHTVRTNITLDRSFSSKDLKAIARFGDFSPAILKNIGRNTARNRLIANHYVENRGQYGKTLIFATGIDHCFSLAETLKKMGVKAGYVASKRNDKASNKKILETFRHGGVDVLVSVAMLTEGLDVPSVDTVFLARPTGSEILMRQMVGRGMRGPKSGGKLEVHIVSFSDHWQRFPDWLDPISFLDPAGVISTPKQRRKFPSYLINIPWELISAISEMAPDIEVSKVLSNTPIGWYRLTKSTPESGFASAILVYEHQKEAYERFIQDSFEGRYVLSGRGGALARYFSDVSEPRPTNQSLGHLDCYISEYGRPRFVSFKDKEKFEPEIVARNHKEKTPIMIAEVADEVFDSTLAREYFTSKERYRLAVFAALGDIMSGKKKQINVPVKISKSRKNKKSLPIGSFPLVKIRDEVRKERLLKKKAPDIRWSKKPVKTYWGLYRSSDETIIINRVLKTMAVSRSTIKFLVYHELLHHELGAEIGHRGDFRELERSYPGATNAECELDTLNENYYLPTWFD